MASLLFTIGFTETAFTAAVMQLLRITGRDSKFSILIIYGGVGHNGRSYTTDVLRILCDSPHSILLSDTLERLTRRTFDFKEKVLHHGEEKPSTGTRNIVHNINAHTDVWRIFSRSATPPLPFTQNACSGPGRFQATCQFIGMVSTLFYRHSRNSSPSYFLG